MQMQISAYQKQQPVFDKQSSGQIIKRLQNELNYKNRKILELSNESSRSKKQMASSQERFGVTEQMKLNNLCQEIANKNNLLCLYRQKYCDDQLKIKYLQNMVSSGGSSMNKSAVSMVASDNGVPSEQPNSRQVQQEPAQGPETLAQLQSLQNTDS